MSRSAPPLTRPKISRLLPLAAWSVLAALILVALAVLPIWVVTWYEAHVPRAWRRAVIVAALQALRVAYLAAVVAAPIAVLSCGAILLHARRAGRRAPRAARGLLLGVSMTLSLIGLEAAAGAWLAWTHRLPDPPTNFAQEPPPRIESIPTEFPESEPTGSIHLVVVGESSAEGQPYQPRLSVGQILAWQLERVFPDREVRLTMLASGGINLEQAVLRLDELKAPPDAIVVYAGHNEFQARYGWSRAVRHYLDEEPIPVRTTLGRALGRYSAVCELIAENLDRQQIDRPPPRQSDRSAVDRPAFTPEEYAYLRYDYARRLDGVAAYARKVGALPILIAPAGNEAEYPPARSFLDPSAGEAERAEFARAFLAAREREADDPAGAEAEYRRLASEHPEHAEVRYRLGRLLAARGQSIEARPHLEAARDLDGMPMRCPGDFLAAFPPAAERHDALYVDGRAVLSGLTPDGLLDLRVLHDAQHPTLRSYVALTQKVLDGLAGRRAFGWPEGLPAPRIDPAEAAAHFDLDPDFWATVCERSSVFYGRIAGIHYDQSEHLALADRWARASEAIKAGAAPEAAGMPGLGIAPAGLIENSEDVPPVTAGPGEERSTSPATAR